MSIDTKHDLAKHDLAACRPTRFNTTRSIGAPTWLQSEARSWTPTLPSGLYSPTSSRRLRVIIAISVLFLTFSFFMMCLRCTLTVFSLILGTAEAQADLLRLVVRRD